MSDPRRISRAAARRFLAERHLLVARQPWIVVPAKVRKRFTKAIAKLVDLPSQVEIFEQLIGECLHLCPLLG